MVTRRTLKFGGFLLPIIRVKKYNELADGSYGGQEPEVR
jgi:hypothetical protein